MLLATKGIKMQVPSHLCAEKIINRKTSWGRSLPYLLADRCTLTALHIQGPPLKADYCCNNPATRPRVKPPRWALHPDMPSNLFCCKFLHCQICLPTMKRKEQRQSIWGLELGVGPAPSHQEGSSTAPATILCLDKQLR